MKPARPVQIKRSMHEDLDTMVEDGFVDEERRDALQQQLEESGLESLDQLRQQIERENELFIEYQQIKEEVI